MSTITGSTDEAVYKIEKFLGLNENPDGDTKLKLGEAVTCRNWKVTRDNNLQRRPGTKTLFDFGGEVKGMWTGYIDNEFHFLVAANEHLYDVDVDDAVSHDLGYIDTTNRVNFFPFSNIVYILNGVEYMQYDGIALTYVKGYRPLVITNRTPDASSSSLLEEVNKLNGLRRLWFTGDGKSTKFVLPVDTMITSVDYLMWTSSGDYIDPSEYTVTLNGNDTGNYEYYITMNEAPGDVTNVLEVGYSVGVNYRYEVTGMTNAEMFLGSQDNCVFIYGNGTNEAFYSGIDYDGKPRADYFPDLNEMAVADANTPITSLIRHYSQLICYKSHSAYTVQYGLITLADSSQEYGFYVTPINRAIGNEALGQVRLVLNSPYTLHGNELYEWKNTSSYSSNLTVDERQARRISDKIYNTLRGFDFEKCYCYDDNDNQEYYICYGDTMLVQNYAVNAWYTYTGITANCLANIDDKLFIGTNDGRVLGMASNYYNDDGQYIEAYWESGSMDFGKNYMRKMMSQMWLGIKPEPVGQVYVTVETDKKSIYTEKVVVSDVATFGKFNFARFSFNTNRKPQMKKLKIKAKKFAFMKLVLRSPSRDESKIQQDDYTTAATVLVAQMRVRTTGYVK